MGVHEGMFVHVPVRSRDGLLPVAEASTARMRMLPQ